MNNNNMDDHPFDGNLNKNDDDDEQQQDQPTMDDVVVGRRTEDDGTTTFKRNHTEDRRSKEEKTEEEEEEEEEDDDDDDASVSKFDSKFNKTQIANQNQTDETTAATATRTRVVAAPARACGVPEAKNRKKPDVIVGNFNHNDNNNDKDNDNDNDNNQKANNNKRKRRIRDDSSSSSLNKKRSHDDVVVIAAVETILDLPDDPIGFILEFVGPGEYLYMASVCKKFRNIYTMVFGEKITINTNDDNHQKKKAIATTVASKTDNNTTTSKMMIVQNNDTSSNKKDEEGKIILIPYTKTFARKSVESIPRVQFYLKQQHPTKSNLILAAQAAGTFGQIQVLDHVMEQQPADIDGDNSHSSLWEDDDLVNEVRIAASKYGQLHVLKHTMKQTNFGWTIESLEFAVFNRQLDTIQWLLKETDCPRNDTICGIPAIRGCVDVLKCLIASGCPYNKNTLILAAAAEGKLEIIKYVILELNCPWFEYRIGKEAILAAENGNLHCLQWMVENGCPWDRFKCRSVAESNGHINVVTWIDENNNNIV